MHYSMTYNLLIVKIKFIFDRRERLLDSGRPGMF